TSAFLLPRDHKLQQGSHAERIKAEEGLIHNIERRFDKKCAHNHNLLLHPLRQMLRKAVKLVTHLELIPEHRAALRKLFISDPVYHSRELKMLPDRELLVELRRLGDISKLRTIFMPT